MKISLIKKKLQITTLVFLLSMTHISPIHGQSSDLSPDDIIAEAAIVMDADTGDIYFNKKMHRQMYPASVTKLMTALLVLENTSMSDDIIFSENAIKSLEYGSSSIGIRVGERLTIDQTMHGLLLMSANETANALAEQVSGSIDDFVNLMNTKAVDMGLNNTHFTNPHGLFNERHYTSAYDIALITKDLIQWPEFMAIMKASMYEIPPTNKCEETRYLAQQHKMLNDKNDMRIYREDVIAGKVGYTSESGHTLVTVADNGSRKLIVAIFNSDNTSRYSDTDKLINYGYTAKAIPSQEIADDSSSNSKDDKTNTESKPNTPKSSTVTARIIVSDSIESSGNEASPNGLSTSTSDKQSFFNRTLALSKHFVGIIIIACIVGVSSFLLIKDRARRKRLKRKRDRFHDLKL